MNNLIFELIQDENSHVHFKKEEKSWKWKQKSENQGSIKKVEQEQMIKTLKRDLFCVFLILGFPKNSANTFSSYFFQIKGKIEAIQTFTKLFVILFIRSSTLKFNQLLKTCNLKVTVTHLHWKNEFIYWISKLKTKKRYILFLEYCQKKKNSVNYLQSLKMKSQFYFWKTFSLNLKLKIDILEGIWKKSKDFWRVDKI